MSQSRSSSQSKNKQRQTVFSNKGNNNSFQVKQPNDEDQ